MSGVTTQQKTCAKCGGFSSILDLACNYCGNPFPPPEAPPAPQVIIVKSESSSTISCAYCQNANVRNVPALIQESVTRSSTAYRGATYGTYGVGAVGGVATSTSTTDLARHLGPPGRMQENKNANPMILLAVFGALSFMCAVGGLFAKQGLAGGIFFLVVAACFGLWALSYYKRLPLDKQAKDYNSRILPTMLQHYNQCVYCDRCGNVTEPHVKVYAPPANFAEMLYNISANP